MEIPTYPDETPENINTQPEPAGGYLGPFPTLTPREREVALLLADGRTNREIAAMIEVSIKTVDTHRGHILQKLELKNNVALCKLSIRSGWTVA